MSEENERNMVTLREHIKEVFEQYQKHHAREHELLAANITRAQAVADERLDHLNRMKEQNTAERANFVSRDLFDARIADLLRSSASAHGAQDAKIATLEKVVANLLGRMTAIAGAITVGLVVLQLLLRLVVKV